MEGYIERERRVIASTPDLPPTVESLTADLRALGVEEGMALIVHASLSAMGWVCGGAAAVILALEAALGETGTLVMPAHCGDLTDPADWNHPPVPPEWVPVIRAHTPPFDPDLTPTRGMGAIAETFRKQRGTLRSGHPTASFTARGPNAERITSGHTLDFALGEGSPLARLYDLDGWVLLLGVGHGNNTSIHLAEYRADGPWKQTRTRHAPILRDGRRVWAAHEDLGDSPDDFERIGEAYEETGPVRIGRVGCAASRLMPQRPLVDFAAAWMTEHR